MPNPGGPGTSPAANQYPPTSPQNAAIYINAHLDGDNGQPGGTVAALQQPGSTLGAQWLSWYMTTHAKYGNQATLEQYVQAFILIWEDVKTGQNLATATAGGLAAAGGFAGAAGGIGNAIAAGVGAGASTQLGGNLLGAITSPLQFFSSSQFWVRTGEVLLGLVLVSVGMVKLAETSSLAKTVVNNVPAIKAARKIVP